MKCKECGGDIWWGGGHETLCSKSAAMAFKWQTQKILREAATALEKQRRRLRRCECGAGRDKLRFERFHMGSGAYVYCTECALGTPLNPCPGLIARDPGGDATAMAVRKWNAVMRRSKPRSKSC